MTKRMLLIAATICLTVGCDKKKPEDVGGQSSPVASTKDNEFIATVTEANLTEIDTGKMAESMGQSPEIKAFGKTLVDDHTAAGKEAGSVANAIGAKLPTELDSDHKSIVDGLKEKTGPQFDEAFVNAQIKAHEKTIKAVEDERDNGSNTKLKDLAVKLLPTLTAHLEKAKSLKAMMEPSATGPTTKPM